MARRFITRFRMIAAQPSAATSRLPTTHANAVASRFCRKATAACRQCGATFSLQTFAIMPLLDFSRTGKLTACGVSPTTTGISTRARTMGRRLQPTAPGQLHAVWFSGASANPGAFYGRLGTERPSGVRRIGGDSAEHPDLAIAGDRVVFAWKEFDGQRSILRAMILFRSWHEFQRAQSGDDCRRVGPAPCLDL